MADPVLSVAMNYIVTITYLKGGRPQTYEGRFVAFDSTRATENARQFVRRYLRPQEITGVSVIRAS
jgi:hypothetical protein